MRKGVIIEPVSNIVDFISEHNPDQLNALFLDFILDNYNITTLEGYVVNFSDIEKSEIEKSLFKVDSLKKIMYMTCLDIVDAIGSDNFIFVYRNIYKYKKNKTIQTQIDLILSDVG